MNRQAISQAVIQLQQVYDQLACELTPAECQYLRQEMVEFFEGEDDEDPYFDDEGEDERDDTPSLANCDDWGTGEGRYHGRM